MLFLGALGRLVQPRPHLGYGNEHKGERQRQRRWWHCWNLRRNDYCALIGELFYAVVGEAVLRVVMAIVALALSGVVWSYLGAMVWKDRGQGVMLIEARASYAF